MSLTFFKETNVLNHSDFLSAVRIHVGEVTVEGVIVTRDVRLFFEASL